MSTLLERSGGKNGKFCQQTKRRRREAYRARRQLICPEWHFLKKDKRQEECNWHSASTKQLETDCGPAHSPRQTLALAKARKFTPLWSWPTAWKMCRRFEDCLVSRTGFRIFIVSVLLIFVAALCLNFGWARNPKLIWFNKEFSPPKLFLLNYYCQNSQETANFHWKSLIILFHW